jgi:NADH-quinone oxidoreductase subunit F
VDIHFTAATATTIERAAVDAVLGPAESGWGDVGRRAEAESHFARGGKDARRSRHLLLPALHAVADRVGWIGEGALNYIALRLMVPPAEAYGVASFYALFALEPRPPSIVHVCDDVVCVARGAGEVIRALEESVGPAGSPLRDGASTWMRSPCLGLCERAPAALIQSAGEEPRMEPIESASADRVRAALDGRRDFAFAQAVLPQHGDPSLRLLRRIGVVDPTSVDGYRAAGGFVALRRAFELGPNGVLRELAASRLMGRGGAAFPTGRKWEAVAREPERPHYVVCNADESEPGTFKDRILMEEDPFALIEAMTIGAYATGCETGYVYVRGEYPLARARLEGALAQARAHGMLGDDVLGRGFRFDIEVRRGAGAYICGEETALFNSLEGYRGEPRNKPPFPVQKGLFGKPTVVNNVETLVNVLDIVAEGGDAFASIGTADSTGTKLFCVCGCVERPGLYEMPLGVTLRALIDAAGGVPGGRRLQTVLLGGAAGAFATPDELDTPLSFEGVRRINATLGSGVVVVFDETIDLERILVRIAAFFRDESCGQCVPCRVGTVRQEELLARLAGGRLRGTQEEERRLLAEIGQVMRDASICGLGQTASSAVESALAKLPVFGAGSAT